jgi:hypothetical protein
VGWLRFDNRKIKDLISISSKCASTLLIRFVWVKWELVLVTFGDQHHLDDLVVFGRLLVITRWSLWVTHLMVWAVVGDSSCRSDKKSSHSEHLVLKWIEGELYSCAGAPTRTNRECWLSNSSRKHHCAPFPLFTLCKWILDWSLYMCILLCNFIHAYLRTLDHVILT